MRVTRKQHDEAVQGLHDYSRRIVEMAFLKALTTNPAEWPARPEGPTPWEAIPATACVCSHHRCYWESSLHVPDANCRCVIRGSVEDQMSTRR